MLASRVFPKNRKFYTLADWNDLRYNWHTGPLLHYTIILLLVKRFHIVMMITSGLTIIISSWWPKLPWYQRLLISNAVALTFTLAFQRSNNSSLWREYKVLTVILGICWPSATESVLCRRVLLIVSMHQKHFTWNIAIHTIDHAYVHSYTMNAGFEFIVLHQLNSLFPGTMLFQICS